MKDYERFSEALEFAARKHKEQTRNDGVTPYIYHPISVAELVKKTGFGIDYQIVAILHDTLEDTDATEDEIRYFGEDILEAVKLLTRAKGADENEYVAAILQNELASVVKNADKISNLWDSCFNGVVGEKRTDEAKAFADRYIKKAEKFYQGKFSKAMDDSIEVARKHNALEDIQEIETPNYSREEMRLYSC